jgi:hypothetical protein
MVLFFSMAEEYYFVYLYHSFLIYSSTDGYLSWFCDWQYCGVCEGKHGCLSIMLILILLGIYSEMAHLFYKINIYI